MKKYIDVFAWQNALPMYIVLISIVGFFVVGLSLVKIAGL
jgi:hypothetical protein